MSRGIGRAQREILEQLRAMNAGAGVLVGDNGANTRRAAHGLARRGLLILEYRTFYGRRRLVARLPRPRESHSACVKALCCPVAFRGAREGVPAPIGRRRVPGMDDGFDDAQQPRCPECGTVLTSLRRGFVCCTCDLVFVDAMPSSVGPR